MKKIKTTDGLNALFKDSISGYTSQASQDILSRVSIYTGHSSKEVMKYESLKKEIEDVRNTYNFIYLSGLLGSRYNDLFKHFEPYVFHYDYIKLKAQTEPLFFSRPSDYYSSVLPAFHSAWLNAAKVYLEGVDSLALVSEPNVKYHRRVSVLNSLQRSRSTADCCIIVINSLSEIKKNSESDSYYSYYERAMTVDDYYSKNNYEAPLLEEGWNRIIILNCTQGRRGEIDSEVLANSYQQNQSCIVKLFNK